MMYRKVSMMAKTFWHAICGILAEVALAAAIVVAAFFVCILWWSVL